MAEPGAVGSIVLDVLADGRVVISSTFAGRFDSAYMPLPDARAPVEVARLLAELREQQAREIAYG